jgi:(p)ppGpp synthase/HD superfamily hydrolase
MPADPHSPEALAADLRRALGRPLGPAVGAMLALSCQAHAGQVRRAREGAAPLPYIVHPFGAARLCVRHHAAAHLPDGLDTVLCIALAHDILEDTPTDPAFIELAAGRRVREYTEVVTRPAATAGVDRMTTAAFAARIVAGGPTAVFVKICDSMDNLREPELIPPGLLGRLAKKAREHYLPMLDRCDLGPDLRAAYEDALAAAEDELARAGAPAAAED